MAYDYDGFEPVIVAVELTGIIRLMPNLGHGDENYNVTCLAFHQKTC